MAANLSGMATHFAPDPITISGQRGFARVELNILAVATFPGGRQRCTIQNLSASGARLALSAPPPIGTLVSLLIDRLEVFGTVVWAIDGQCGIGFDGLPGVGPLAAMRHLGERNQALQSRPERGASGR